MENIEICIPFELHFRSHSNASGWDSGFKTLQDFLDKYNIQLVGKSVDYPAKDRTRVMQVVNVEQKFKIPLEGELEKTDLYGDSNKISIRHLNAAYTKERWLLDHPSIEIQRHERGKVGTSLYLLRISERNEWIGITNENDFVWEIGTINTRYVGPCSLTEEADKIIETTYKPNKPQNPRYDKYSDTWKK